MSDGEAATHVCQMAPRRICIGWKTSEFPTLSTADTLLHPEEMQTVYKYFITVLQETFILYHSISFSDIWLVLISCTKTFVLSSCLLVSVYKIQIRFKVIHLLFELLLEVELFELHCCVVQHKSECFFEGG